MAFGRVGALGRGFGHLGAGSGVSALAGGGLLLAAEADGFAADFTWPVDSKRVAVKTAGTVVSSGTSFFTSSGTSSKWVYDINGTLVNIPVGTLPLDYDPVTHAAKGLLCEPAATNLLLNNATLSTQSVTVTATAYTLSIFGTGTVTLTGTSTAGPLAGTGANNRVSLTFTPTAGSLTLTVSGSVTKAQLETGTVATSTIPTIGSTVTRAMDNYNVMPASINYSATAGSWWVEPNLLRIIAAGTDRLISYSSSYAPIYMGSGAFHCYDGGVLTSSTNNLGLGVKVAMAFQSSDRALTGNGLAPTTSATAGINLAVPGASIFFGSGGGASPIHGYIRKVRYLPRRPSNAELQTMTA